MVPKLNEGNLLKKLQDQDWVRSKFVPLLVLLGERCENDLHQTNRTGTFDAIKYRQGWFDGIHTLYSMINGITTSNQEVPSRMGQLASILGLGRK